MTMAVAPAAFVTALEDAAEQGTGCLYVADSRANRSGRVFFRDGKVYAVQVDGFLPKIGRRLRTGGMLTQAEYETLLEVHQNNHYAPALGLTAVERGYVDQEVLDAVLREVLLSSVGAMFSYDNLTAKFKRNTSTEQFTIPAVSVAAIIKATTKRQQRWTELWDGLAPGQDPQSIYPTALSTVGHGPNQTSEVAAVLAAATGNRSVDDVAGECGLTRFETGHVLSGLVANNDIAMRTSPGELDAEQGDPHAAVTTTNYGTAESATAESPTADSETMVVESSDEDSTLYQDPEEPAAPHGGEGHDPHFAPDVIETLNSLSTQTESDTEQTTFGEVEETFPDGMDVGSIPTEQIERDLEFVTPSTPSTSAVAEPLDPAEVTFHSPPPLPANIPHTAEPVTVTPKHAGEPVTETAEVDLPVFVDASAIDLGAPPSSVVFVSDMPGVPLPPLPDFIPSPETHAPVQALTVAVQAVEPPDSDTPSAPETETERLQQSDVESTDEGIQDAPTADGPKSHDPAPAPTEDPSATAERARLEQEIALASDAERAAQQALQRAQEDHESNLAATKQNEEVLARRRTDLLEGETETERLQSLLTELVDAEQAAQSHHAAVSETLDEVTRTAQECQARVDEAQEELARAEAALRKALGDAHDADTERDIAAQNEEIAAHDETQVRQRLSTVQADLTSLRARLDAYRSDIEESERFAHTLAEANAGVEALQRAAEERLIMARRNLDAKQDLLAQLG